jgi:ribosome-binding factor A
MMAIRAERVSAEIRKVISEYLIHGLRTPLPGFVTVSNVVVSPDLSVAKISYSVFGSDDEIALVSKILEAEKWLLRQEVAKKMRLRIVPNLVLSLDKSPEKVAHIHKILNNLPK